MNQPSSEVNHRKAFILGIQHLLAMYSGGGCRSVIDWNRVALLQHSNDLFGFNRYFHVRPGHFSPTCP